MVEEKPKVTKLTPEGLIKLEDELEYLKSTKRIEVADRIKQAIEFGDISENSEYEDAKNEQAFIEGRIITLEKMLRNAIVIESNQTNTEIISMGSKVTLKDLEFGDEEQYSIVGSAEVDPIQNKISDESPVGAAIVGKKVGEIVEVNVQDGILKYEITAVN